MEGRVCFEYRWGLNQCWSMHYVIQSPFSISITIINGLIHRTICHRVSAAIRIGRPINTFAPSVVVCIARIICHRLSAAICCIGRPICLCSSAAICIDRSICHRLRVAICVGQPKGHPESAAICIDYTNMPPSSTWFTIHTEIHIVSSKVW